MNFVWHAPCYVGYPSYVSSPVQWQLLGEGLSLDNINLQVWKHSTMSHILLSNT